MTKVKVSSRNQIAVPRIAREQLGIQSGDHLLVDIQDGLLILWPMPKSYTEQLSGLHREIWQGIDTAAYLETEREAWEKSESD